MDSTDSISMRAVRARNQTEGSAWMAVYTGRFFPEDVVGHTVIIHEKADDFRTQPSGDAGKMIACGEITIWE